MDRQIVYPGAIPLETDLLNSNKYALIGLSKLAAAILGTTTMINGLACTPNSPADLTVKVAAGEIYSLQNIDGTAYSSLALDTTHQILKQGISLDQQTLSCPAPGTAGQSINYLVQITYTDTDSGSTVLPYYNASNPATAYSGPANAGTAQNTVRKGVCTIAVKAGTAATTGTQTTPAPDSGYVGAWAVTVANGQTQITAPNIVQYSGAPFLSASGLVVGGFQNNSFNIAPSAGTADAITGAYTPAILALTNGMTLYVRAGSANATTTPTFKANGTAVKGIVKGAGTSLSVGDIAGAGHWIELQYDLVLDKWVLLNPATGVGSFKTDPMALYKASSVAHCFTKTAAGTISVLAGTHVMVAGTLVSFIANTAVVMPTLTSGTDYAIYACTDGTIRADASFTAPTGYTTGNSRMIGGFHYGLVAPATTVAGGSFNTAGSVVTGGMVWTQADVDAIAGINKWSIWDLKFRPASDPRGMVLVNGRTWVDIYLCSTDTAANGTSKYNTNIASGTVLPKIPAAFGGDGTTTYNAMNWWPASELARANQKRLLLASEFYDAAFGVTENQSIDATASTYPTTLRNAGYTSKYGIEQASGHHWTWGQDAAGSASAYAANGGRGQSYNNIVVRVILGGARTFGAFSGSRCSHWSYVTSYSNWYYGLRAACDHLQLA